MAVHWSVPIRFFVLVLAGFLPSAARADSGVLGLDPPVFDGVHLDLRADNAAPEWTSYRFEGGRDWPAVRFLAGKPLDWSRAGGLSFEVENRGPDSFKLLLRLDDDIGADGGDRSLTGVVDLAPGARTTLVLPLDTAPLGMRGRPSARLEPRAGERLITTVSGAVNLRHVVALHLSGFRTDAAHHLAFGKFALRDRARSPAFGEAIADAFGQAVRGTWPEKIDSVAALRSRLREAAIETERLGHLRVPAADRFGGIGAGPRLPTSLSFRVEKLQGRWTFVTPAGHRFFSLGVDAVTASNPTIVEGRERLFTNLPVPGHPLERYYQPGADGGARTFDVGQANIERGLGPAWTSRWPSEVTGRLTAWGFNTLGNWSEPAVTDRAAMPHVSFYDFEGASGMVPMAGGRSLPDPFDPRFAQVADEVARAMTATRKNDPYLLGYSSGNELPWGTVDQPGSGIAARVLALDGASPAKQALFAELRARYGSARSWAAAWRIAGVRDWADAVNRSLSWPSPAGDAATRDAAAFAGQFAELYFRTVATAIKRYDPHHLYLGTRFAAATPEVVAACARWCDVMSFNVYGLAPEAEAPWRAFDRPVLIGEFHFGSTDRGSFWPGMVDVGREADRGPAYAAYLRTAVNDPAIVGCHWYQYADEPLTGRPYDGENGHIGLVTVTDLPYSGFIRAVAAANRETLQTFSEPFLALHGTR